MPTLPTQQKALFLESKQGSFAVRTTDVPKPGAGEVLARVDAAALNPIDWMIQAFGVFIEHYPSFSGVDGAGIVVEIGEGVTSFAVGDRIAWQSKVDMAGKKVVQGTFVQYAAVPIAGAIKIPANISLDAAASIPCTLPTAAFPLYNQSASGLRLTAPWLQDGKGKYAGKSALVMGGSSSVGQYVIQFLNLSGFSTIVGVASSRHEEYLKSIGATHVVDRSLPAETLKAQATAPLAGAFFDVVYNAVCTPETTPVAYALTAAEGDFIYASFGAQVPVEEGSKKRVHLARGLLALRENKEIAASLVEGLPKVLATGYIKPNRIEVLSGGLHAVSDGLKRLKAGQVSGVKLVVLPQDTA